MATFGDKLRHCNRCGLSKTRHNVVIGRGSKTPKIMFIGEAPGRNEDLQGKPFVGRSGQLLEKAIGDLGIKSEDYYISNLVKCRPSVDEKDRHPKPDEIKACHYWLDKQLEHLKPLILIPLGKYATEYILGRPVSIMAIAGNKFKVGDFVVYPLIHPAAVLYNPNNQQVWARGLGNIYNEIRRVVEVKEKASQQTLF